LRGMDTVYLVDGSAYIHRAYHAIRPLSNSGGLPTHAVYGFTTILRRILREKSPSFLAVAWDTPGEVFRHRIYPEYKANRPSMPEDLAVQIPYIHQVVDAYGLVSMAHDDLEADDLIASAVRRLTDRGHQVVVVSGDKDLLQLVSGRVLLWDPMNDRLMDENAVREKYGLAPSLLLDYLALTGDASDNIPGVPGVGPKTAARLLDRYGSLEGIYEHLPSMKASKMKERLAAHRNEAFLSRDLVRLEEGADVPDDAAGYAVGPPDRERLRSLFTELEFHTLLATDAPADKMEASGFHLVTDEADLAALVDRLSGHEHLVLDTETTSLDPASARLVGISLAVEGQEAWYLPCGHLDASGQRLDGQLAQEVLVRCLRPLLEDRNRAKIGHHLKYDLAVLARPENGGIRLRGPLYDTMIGAWLLDPGRRSYRLDDLCREAGLELTSFSQVTGGSGKDGVFARVELAAARDYSCEDVAGSLALYRRQRPRLEKNGLWSLFAELEGPLIPVLARMEEAGILVDRDALAGLAREFTDRLKDLEEEIHRLAGHPFNINSPQQLARVLFDELGLPRGRKTKTGYSTDVKVLEKLKAEHPLPGLILDYRNLAKLSSTYVSRLLELADQGDGRIHTSFNQCGTATGRLSSSDPNLQNIPIRTPEGRRIRSAFIAPAGSVLVSADYSQIDLRVLAHYSGDPALVEAFRRGEDIHRLTAAEIFSVSPKLVTREMRRVAKTINFGIVYGMSSFGLAGQLGIGRKEAQHFIDRYFSVYGGVRDFMEQVADQAAEDGYVTTLLGRRRLLPEINSPNRTRREFARRTAINTPIQGTAADIIKLAMLEVDRRLEAEGLQSRMILQIHDELVLESPKEEVERVSALLRRAMEGVLSLSVPLVVNIETGQNLDHAE